MNRELRGITNPRKNYNQYSFNTIPSKADVDSIFTFPSRMGGIFKNKYQAQALNSSVSNNKGMQFQRVSNYSLGLGTGNIRMGSCMPNGNIPIWETNGAGATVWVFNPYSRTIESSYSTGFSMSENSYKRAFYINGKLFIAPNTSTRCAYFDVENRKRVQFGDTFTNPGTLYTGFTYHAPTGLLVATPQGAGNIICVDPYELKTFTIGSGIPGNYGSQGNVEHPNGKIYCASDTGSQTILEIDVAARSYSFSRVTIAGGNHGSMYYKDGKLWIFPNGDGSRINIYDPENQTIELVLNSSTVQNMFWCDKLHPNGKIYGCPSQFPQTNFLEYDLDTRTLKTLDTMVGFSFSFYTTAGVFSNDGRIFFHGYRTDRMWELQFNGHCSMYNNYGINGLVDDL
jgi:hypothetical protein